MRVIFLVGDAPPHLDYQDGYHYGRAVAAARQKGIAVEAIQCGADRQTARFWQEIAGLGGGHYAQYRRDRRHADHGDAPGRRARPPEPRAGFDRGRRGQRVGT